MFSWVEFKANEVLIDISGTSLDDSASCEGFYGCYLYYCNICPSPAFSVDVSEE